MAVGIVTLTHESLGDKASRLLITGSATLDGTTPVTKDISLPIGYDHGRLSMFSASPAATVVTGKVLDKFSGVALSDVDTSGSGVDGVVGAVPDAVVAGAAVGVPMGDITLSFEASGADTSVWTFELELFGHAEGSGQRTETQ